MTKILEKLWYTRCPVPTGLGIAVEHGWLNAAFAPFGTRIESLRETSDQAVRAAHFDHTLQDSIRHGGNIPAIWARSAGAPTRVLGLSWADDPTRQRYPNPARFKWASLWSAKVDHYAN